MYRCVNDWMMQHRGTMVSPKKVEYKHISVLVIVIPKLFTKSGFMRSTDGTVFINCIEQCYFHPRCGHHTWRTPYMTLLSGTFLLLFFFFVFIRCSFFSILDKVKEQRKWAEGKVQVIEENSDYDGLWAKIVFAPTKLTICSSVRLNFEDPFWCNECISIKSVVVYFVLLVYTSKKIKLTETVYFIAKEYKRK